MKQPSENDSVSTDRVSNVSARRKVVSAGRYVIEGLVAPPASEAANRSHCHDSAVDEMCWKIVRKISQHLPTSTSMDSSLNSFQVIFLPQRNPQN